MGLVTLTIVGTAALVFGAAFLLDYARALGLARADNLKLRQREQTARMVIAEMLEVQNPFAVQLAQQWLREGDLEDPRILFRAAQFRQGRRG